MQRLGVAFEDVRIVQAVPAAPEEDVTLRVLLDHSGRFQARRACMHAVICILAWLPSLYTPLETSPAALLHAWCRNITFTFTC